MGSKKKSDQLQINESIYMCFDCIKQRGYRFPELTDATGTVKTCTFCQHHKIVWDIDDLLAIWEVESE